MQISYDEGNVVLTEVRDFDLAQTLECGQCFHFKKLAEQEYAVCAFHRLLRIRQEKDSVILFDTTMLGHGFVIGFFLGFGLLHLLLIGISAMLAIVIIIEVLHTGPCLSTTFKEFQMDNGISCLTEQILVVRDVNYRFIRMFDKVF